MSTVDADLAEVHVEPLGMLVPDVLRRATLQGTADSIEVSVRIVLAETAADDHTVARLELTLGDVRILELDDLVLHAHDESVQLEIGNPTVVRVSGGKGVVRCTLTSHLFVPVFHSMIIAGLGNNVNP